MRLINVDTYELEDFLDCTQVDYAVLSHRWETEEVLFKDITRIDSRTDHLKSMKGFFKIQKSCERAKKIGRRYVWVDTCCIDKSSSAELQEAINSMFRWYANADICFAYLSDVKWSENEDSLKDSQWFKRGWTLQELLAPGTVMFYDADWQSIGYREQLAPRISKITGIAKEVLGVAFKPSKENKPCIANIMSWAHGRKTTRLEDRAYSLLGLLDVNMPMLYGEGEKAFYRLQCELLKQTEDQSIFAWDRYPKSSPGLLALSPDNFKPSPTSVLLHKSYILARRKAHDVTNEGVDLEVKLIPILPRTYIALLNLQYQKDADEGRRRGTDKSTVRPHSEAIGIYLRRIDDGNRYARIPGSFLGASSDLVQSAGSGEISQMRRITVVRRVDAQERWRYENVGQCGFFLASTPECHDHWNEWLRAKAVTISKGSWNAEKRLLTGAEPAIGLAACVQASKDYKGSVKPSPFANFALGYDFDFLPVCVLSISRGDRELSGRMFAYILVIPPNEDFENHHFLKSTTFSVRSCIGGQYRIIDDDTVAFRINNVQQYYPMPLVASIRLATGRNVLFALSQTKGESRWNVHIDLDNEDSHWFRRRVQETFNAKNVA